MTVFDVDQVGDVLAVLTITKDNYLFFNSTKSLVVLPV